MRTKIATIVIAAILIIATISTPLNGNISDIFNTLTSEVNAATKDCTNAKDTSNPCHEIVIEAAALPDGLYAYRMAEHKFYPDGAGGASLDLTYKYSSKPSIPGPTIILKEGDEAFVTIVNRVDCDSFPDATTDGGRETPSISRIGIHVHGVHYEIDSDGTPRTVNGLADEAAECDGGEYTYHWVAAEGTRGTWPYHDHTFLSELGGEGLGLFGTLIVNPNNEIVEILDEENPSGLPLGEVKKEFVLWMVSTEALGKSIFYGMEIDNENGGKQTPLWTNPTLQATENDYVRFHILGMGDEIHAWHLHAHRWLEPGTEHIIDTKEILPLEKHVFVVKAGEGVGPGSWMYHCHVLRHMEEGMSGMFMVLPEGEDDTLPDVGAVFTLSDEPGMWMKTIDRGVLEGLNPEFPNNMGAPLSQLGLDSNSRSLAVIEPEQAVVFNMKDSVTIHTITSLIFPAGAQNMPYDKQLMIRGSTEPIKLVDEGLYVLYVRYILTCLVQ